jgi:hypothetical protein
MQTYGNDDGVITIWREVKVAGVPDRNCLSLFPCGWINLNEIIAFVVQHPHDPELV